MKIFNFLFLIIIISSCSSDPVCECFEYRLKIKKLLNSADGDYDKYREIKNSEEYKKLRAKKIECRDKIEPEYFKENKIERKGRGDKQFLMEEFGDCQAVVDLMEGNY
tara:strand:+ start:517 stop:840 length:324 start_codon:yes stop_codon:yes gene_type:complete